MEPVEPAPVPSHEGFTPFQLPEDVALYDNSRSITATYAPAIISLNLVHPSFYQYPGT